MNSIPEKGDIRITSLSRYTGNSSDIVSKLLKQTKERSSLPPSLSSYHRFSVINYTLASIAGARSVSLIRGMGTEREKKVRKLRKKEHRITRHTICECVTRRELPRRWIYVLSSLSNARLTSNVTRAQLERSRYEKYLASREHPRRGSSSHLCRRVSSKERERASEVVVSRGRHRDH